MAFRRSHYRHHRVLVGGRSRNLGSHNLLVTKPKGDSDTPLNLVLVANLQPNGDWNLTANWTAPTGESTPINYTIELQQTLVNPGPALWVSPQTINPLTAPYNAVPEGIYRVRVRANYPAGSDWVISNTVYAFITTSFDFSGDPQFHTTTIAGVGGFSHG